MTDLIKEMISDNNLECEHRLFGWEDRTAPSRALRKAEDTLSIKIRGREFHGIRRSFSKRLIKSKLDISTVQNAMRHRSITTTMSHYVEFNKDEVIADMNKHLEEKVT